MQKKTAPPAQGYRQLIGETARLLQDADRVLLGIGSGLSAAGGLDYLSLPLAQKWFPEYVADGCKSIAEIQSRFWWQRNCRLEHYWGYWARHILHIRYETPAARPYLDLMGLVRDKAYFVCTTNADGQVEKAGFPREKVFAPQGDYRYFQCVKPCSQEIYDNRNTIERMVANMPDATSIRTEDIPKCPKCGGDMIPNLRCDDNFVDDPHLWNAEAYEGFVDSCGNKKLLLLELGVGFNTPVIIRHPFERIAKACPDATLVRVNMVRPQIAAEIGGISLQEDLAKVLDDLKHA